MDNDLWKCNSELRFPVLPGESASYGMLLLPPIATEDANFVLDTQYDLIESQYVRAQNFYAENAKLYHDIKHHLRALERLLQNGDQERGFSIYRERAGTAAV